MVNKKAQQSELDKITWSLIQKITKKTSQIIIKKKMEEVSVVQKEMLDAQVILLMDLNRQYIKGSKFWKQGTIILKKTSTAKELVDIINKYDFCKADHIIISAGTNNTGPNDRSSAEEIINNII